MKARTARATPSVADLVYSRGLEAGVGVLDGQMGELVQQRLAIRKVPVHRRSSDTGGRALIHVGLLTPGGQRPRGTFKDGCGHALLKRFPGGGTGHRRLPGSLCLGFAEH